MALSTEVRSTEAAEQQAAAAAFDPQAWAAENYPAQVEAITGSAVDLAQLLTEVAADPEAAGTRYGHKTGATSPYTYPVSTSGTAGAVQGTFLNLQVPDLPPDVTVRVQIGPAITGTAVRDATGTVEFGQFTNQVDYAAAGTALNDRVRTTVLADVDPPALAGRQVSVVGAVSLLTPDSIAITPVEFEVVP
jgi:predicted lipoprotein